MSNKITDISYGVIVFKGNKVLLVKRKLIEGYDLPKGHPNPGESTLEAATREVAEESGYRDFDLISDYQLIRIGYSFERGETTIEKEVFFYVGKQWNLNEVPQTNHDKTEMETGMTACWVPIKKALSLIVFPSMKQALLEAIDIYMQSLDNYETI